MTNATSSIPAMTPPAHNTGSDPLGAVANTAGRVGVAVAVTVGVLVGSGVALGVKVADGVGVRVRVGTWNGVRVGVTVRVGLGVRVGAAVDARVASLAGVGEACAGALPTTIRLASSTYTSLC